VLGRVIETVTGTTWEAAMRRELFDAIGMTATSFARAPDVLSRAAGHRVDGGRATPLQPTVSRAYGPAGTSVVTTVTDLLRFAAELLADPSMAELRVPHAQVVIRGWLDAWCLGLAKFDWAGGPVWGWDGLIGGERCVLRLMSQHGAALAVMTNGSTGRAMYQALLADLMPEFGVAVPPRNLEPVPDAGRSLSRFVGTYAWPDQAYQVTANARGLVIAGPGGKREALPLDDRSFVVDAADPDDPTVTFGAFDADGRPRVMYDMLWALPRGEG
jgi:CubicO group peptidase (beta-lactamase class C family)